LNRFKTKFGAFSADGREYVMTSPQTPRPWINVICNGDYGMTFSQAGSGYSWRTHGQLNRLTRWEQDLVKDEWGKYLYLRDEKGNVWSAGWKPVCAGPDAYRCRHGIGYSTIESSYFGIQTELTVFVPFDEPLEIWRLNIRNTGRRIRHIALFTYLEWCLGQSPDWHREFHKSFIETEYDRKASAILATKRLWEVPGERGHWNTDWPYVAFHSSNPPPYSYDCDKETFLGMYGSQSQPSAVREGRLMRRAGNWLDPIASLQVKVSIRPNEIQSVSFLVGAADSREQAANLIRKYREPAEVERSFEEVHRRWDGLLNTVEADTPDAAFNLMQNVWLKYQAIAGRLWGRTAYYQTGGAYGFRDQLQDSQVWLAIDPARTLQQISLHARHQFADGSVYHWWHPVTEIGLRNRISDNLLWLPFVVNSYLQETADFSALNISAPWVDDPSPAPLFDHCIRAIDLALQRFSKRGLPLIGEGDWNDGLSAVGLDMKGESVWLAHFLHRILIDFAIIARQCGKNSKAEEYTARAFALKSAINKEAWDGEWYFGATKDSGEKLGSKENSEGTLWLNPQTWSIIAGVADDRRARQLMDVVEQKLEVEIGPLLLRPAYKTPDQEIGYLTRYGPGMRENGGVYTHGACWSIIAAAILGRGETAFRIYSKLNPIMRGKKANRYCAEPYVTAGNIEGPDSAFYGRGGWTWYTGSAAWLFKAGCEWILGVRPELSGLRIDPCIPSGWKGFQVRRNFRGATYNINVRNPDHIECGVRELRIDGELHGQGNGPREKLVPGFPAGTVHDVQVIMGT
jgi:cellobiose phosphorylase